MDKNKLDKIDKLSQSQIDRLNAKNIAEMSLLNFMNTKIQQATQKSEFKKDVEEELKRRVSDTYEKIPTVYLLDLYKTLSKEEVDKEANILNISKEQQKIEVNNHLKNPEASNPIKQVEEAEVQITKNDIKLAKEGISNVNKIYKKIAEIEKHEGK